MPPFILFIIGGSRTRDFGGDILWLHSSLSIVRCCVSWYDIAELVVPIMMSLIEGCCLQSSYCISPQNWWFPFQPKINVITVDIVETKDSNFFYLYNCKTIEFDYAWITNVINGVSNETSFVSTMSTVITLIFGWNGNHQFCGDMHWLLM
jgi:hypothetical protein